MDTEDRGWITRAVPNEPVDREEVGGIPALPDAARYDDSAAGPPPDPPRDDIAGGLPPGAQFVVERRRRRDDAPGERLMQHSRASDEGMPQHMHQRASDRTRWRFDTGHVITLVTTLVSTLVLVLSTYYTLKSQVDHHKEAITRLEATAKSKESADSDLKVVVTKLEELDRRITERLARIEANQEAGGKR